MDNIFNNKINIEEENKYNKILKNINIKENKNILSNNKISLQTSILFYLILVFIGFFIFKSDLYVLNFVLPIFSTIGLWIILNYTIFMIRGVKHKGIVLNYRKSETYIHEVIYKVNNKLIKSFEKSGRSLKFEKDTNIDIYISKYDINDFMIKSKFDIIFGTFAFLFGMFSYIMFITNIDKIV